MSALFQEFTIKIKATSEVYDGENPKENTFTIGEITFRVYLEWFGALSILL